MPDISRNRVDLPAPLCPTSPTLAPWRRFRLMSRSASMIGTRLSVPILPPALPSTAFFSDRLFASKIGKSTKACWMSMLTINHSHPVRDAGSVVAQHEQGRRPTHHGNRPGHDPVPPDDGLAQHRLAQDLQVVHHRVQLGQPGPLRDVRVRVVGQRVVVPDDRRQVEDQLNHAGDDRRDVPEPGGDDAGHDRDPEPVDHQQRERGNRQRQRPTDRLREDDDQDQPDHQVVQEEQRLPPDQPEHVQAQRRGEELDQALVGDEDLAALQDAAGDEIPDQQAGGDVGQELLDLAVEQGGVEDAEPGGEHAHADADPQRAEHRAAVPLLDVLPAQVAPQRPLRPSLAQVTERALPAPGRSGRRGGRLGRVDADGAGHGDPRYRLTDRDRPTRPVGYRYCPVWPPPMPSGICWPPMPGGRPLRICSSCWRAAICWANSAVWMPWKTPSSQPTSCACAIRSSESEGMLSSVNGRLSRCSSSRSSGARPCSSSLMEFSWISRSRDRDASSSGAARTSSSSCLIMVPIRITLAGCSTMSITPPPEWLDSDSSDPLPGTRAMPTGEPSGPITMTCCSSFSGCSDGWLMGPSWPVVVAGSSRGIGTSDPGDTSGSTINLWLPLPYDDAF